MPEETQDEIHVPPLMNGEEVVLPEFWLAENIEYRRNDNTIGRCSESVRGDFLNAAEYSDRMQLPTLAELTHAFYGTDNDGSLLSPDYTRSVMSAPAYGEYIATFVYGHKRAIERPQKLFTTGGQWRWIAEAGRLIPIELPPDGWVVEHDKPTGFPSRTSPNKHNAENIFGDKASYFAVASYAKTDMLLGLIRRYNTAGYGYFCTMATSVHLRDSHIGGRACRRR